MQPEDWFSPSLPSHPGAPQGQEHRGEGNWGEGHRGDCHHLPIRGAATNSHPHPKCFRLPQLLAELAPLGDVFAASHTPKPPAHRGDKSPEFVFVGEAPRFVAMGQVPEVVALGDARASAGLAQVA